MVTSASHTVQVRLEQLVRFYASLAQVLSEAGINGAQLNELFSKQVVAECPHCHIRVPGDEIELVSVTEESSKLPPKLQRLRHGCCAREGCEAPVYSLHLESHAGIEWGIVVEKAAQRIVAIEAEAKEQRRLVAIRGRNRKIRNVCVGIVVMAWLLIVRFVWRHGHLPLMHKSPKYEIDPSFGRKGP